MVDVELFANSLKCKWVKLFLDEGSGGWRSLFDLALKSYGGKFLFECNYNKIDINVSNTFINEVCGAWSDFNFRPPEQFANQYVINNSYIKINNDIFYSSILRSKKAYTVKDFFDSNGKALTYTAFKTKFNITNNFPFTTYFGILRSIPRDWKTKLEPNDCPSDNALRMTSFTTNLRPTKVIYNYLAQLRLTTPRSVLKWEQVSNFNGNWNKVFLLPYVAVRDTKVQYFQFRYIHRIIGTNSFLHKIKLKDSPICTFCNSEHETLGHLFWTCPVTQRFWDNISGLCLKSNFNLTFECVNFGFLDDIKSPINFLILHAKFFLFNCKMNDKIPEGQVFFYKFNFLLQVEHHILCNRNDDLRNLQFQETFNYIH